MGAEPLSLLLPITAMLLLWNGIRIFLPRSRFKATAMLSLFAVLVIVNYGGGVKQWVTWSFIAYPVFYLPASVSYSLISWLVRRYKKAGEAA